VKGLGVLTLCWLMRLDLSAWVLLFRSVILLFRSDICSRSSRVDRVEAEEVDLCTAPGEPQLGRLVCPRLSFESEAVIPKPRGLSREVLAVDGLPSSSCKALSGELYDGLELGECPFLCCLVGLPYKASAFPLYSKALADRISGTCDSLEEPEGTDVSLSTRRCPALTVLIRG
jgi:hypothetical protein